MFGKFKGANLERAFAAPADFGGSEVPRVPTELASSPVNAREFNERLLLALMRHCVVEERPDR